MSTKLVDMTVNGQSSIVGELWIRSSGVGITSVHEVAERELVIIEPLVEQVANAL